MRARDRLQLLPVRHLPYTNNPVHACAVDLRRVDAQAVNFSGVLVQDTQTVAFQIPASHGFVPRPREKVGRARAHRVHRLFVPLKTTHLPPIIKGQLLDRSRVEISTTTEKPTSIQGHNEGIEIQLLCEVLLRRVQRKITAHDAAVGVQGSVAPRIVHHHPLQSVTGIQLRYRLHGGLGEPHQRTIPRRDVEVLRSDAHRHDTLRRLVNLLALSTVQAPPHHTVVQRPAVDVVGCCGNALHPTLRVCAMDEGLLHCAGGQIPRTHSSIQASGAELQEAEPTDQLCLIVQ
mmetsp:Transcript_43082/g.97066  ORF Transcript_43082/g.97066 Transcript_43082/m.97066 type:complete len:289 (+) Transcript_43082:121-987(+)